MFTFPSRLISLVLLAAAAALAPPPRLPAAEPDAKAEQLLRDVIQAYKALPAYRDAGEVELKMTLGGQTQSQKSPQRVTLVKPSRLAVDGGISQLYCDGKTLTVAVGPLKKYTTADAPKAISFNTVFTAGSASSAVFGGPGGPMAAMLLNLLLGDDPARSVRDFGDQLTLEKDRDFQGARCHDLKISAEKGPSFRLLVDTSTRLLQGIEVSIDAKALAQSYPANMKPSLEIYRWVAGKVSTEPAADSAFVFAAPKDFAKVGSLAQAEPPAAKAEEPQFEVQKLVGKPAPSFTLTVLDGPGKTKTVTKGELAGKVVVLDFWATWCGPCLAELPEVQKLVTNYAKNKANVVVVAVSQDNDPRDPVEVRKLVEATLKKHEIALTGNEVGHIAIDPANAVGEAFKIEGYPSVVILDAKGNIAAAHVGNQPDVGKILAGDIDAALAGKPAPHGDKK